MNTIASQIRHFFTFLSGIGGMLLSAHLITPEQVDTANQAGSQLIEPLSILAGLIAAGLARLAIGWFQTLFQKDDGKKGVGRASALLITMGTAAALMGSLPSCSTVVAPDGTKTTAPDAPTVTTVGNIIKWVAEALRPAPQPVAPIVEPSGK